MVSIIMGSKSDLKFVKPCYDILVKFGIEVEVKVMSAHRTPDLVTDFAVNARDNGVKVIIACAGKAAHLAGFIAGNTPLPVIGLPIISSTLDGLDSLLSVVQMPSGVPVATVAINGAQNAGLLAIQMLALSDDKLMNKLIDYKAQLKQSVIDANEGLLDELR